MAAITAAMVMKLRDETGLPMMECKKALQETGGDFELAKQKARESGKKIMSIRQDRTTEEGRIAVYTSLNPGVGAMIELQVESAPVAKHEDVIALANDLAKQLAIAGKDETIGIAERARGSLQPHGGGALDGRRLTLLASPPRNRRTP